MYMGVSYEQNKKHIYTWREQNREKYNESCKICRRNQRIKLNAWKEISKVFLNILIN
jgi:hypothetical protein